MKTSNLVMVGLSVGMAAASLSVGFILGAIFFGVCCLILLIPRE